MDVPGFALVTGAASGIGRKCAETFARDGAAGVALLDINLSALQAVKAEIEAQHPRCQIVVYALDISIEKVVDETVLSVARQFGRIDYLANAAGIAKKHEGGAAFAKLPDWEHVLNVNLTGTFLVMKAVAQIMLKQEPILSVIDGRAVQRGSIVLFASISGLIGISSSTAYAAAKAGVVGLVKTASEDYAKDGLRINAICPGYTETPMTTQNPEVLAAMQDRVGRLVPMQRMGKAQEIADGVIYLCGGRSSFVTGITHLVDGGYTAR